MVIVYMYKPLKQGDTFSTNQLKPTNKASNISFIEHLCNVGSFEFSVPKSDPFCESLAEDNIISVDNKFFGIVRTIDKKEDSGSKNIIVSGYGIKGYLYQRITIYPEAAIAQGLQGYDAINNASTETVAKYFINRNIVNPTNANRKIPCFEIAPDKKRGSLNDQYMSRFESLTNVMQKNLEPFKMGYEITVDVMNNKLVFDVIQGTDHTAEQTENKRLIFDVDYKNLLSLQQLTSNTNYKNIFYSSLSKGRNEAETLTCMYFREGEVESSGATRFEQHLNVSVNLPDAQMYENLKPYALKNAAEYVKTESVIAIPTNKHLYGIDYKIGDFVTVQATQGKGKLALDLQIVTIRHTWTPSGIIHELEFGKERLNKFDLLKREIRNGGT